jgi:hypothetical protein
LRTAFLALALTGAALAACSSDDSNRMNPMPAAGPAAAMPDPGRSAGASPSATTGSASNAASGSSLMTAPGRPSPLQR